MAAARLKLETTPVAGHELVGLFVKAVPGQADVGMRNDDALKSESSKSRAWLHPHSGAAAHYG